MVLLRTFADNVAWTRVFVYLLLATFVLGNFATILQVKYHLHHGYTRKLNHVGIMLLAGTLLGYLPPRQLVPSLLVASVGLMSIYAIAAVSSQSLIKGIISASLRPELDNKSRFHFFFPFATFVVALVLTSIVLPLDFVRVAFFTVALADGLAEPIGIKFGKNNKYSCRDLLWGGLITRTISGSLTVLFIATLLASFVPSPVMGNIVACGLYGISIMLIEAGSPKGLDNALIQFLGPIILVVLQ